MDGKIIWKWSCWLLGKNLYYFVAQPIRDAGIDNEGVAEDEFLMSSQLEAVFLSNSKKTIDQLTFAGDGSKDNEVCYLDTDSFIVEKKSVSSETKSLVTKKCSKQKLNNDSLVHFLDRF